MTRNEAAKVYGVSVSTIDRFVRESRNDPTKLRIMFEEKNKQDDIVEQVASFIVANKNDK